jgi:hypothetical protein
MQIDKLKGELQTAGLHHERLVQCLKDQHAADTHSLGRKHAAALEWACAAAAEEARAQMQARLDKSSEAVACAAREAAAVKEEMAAERVAWDRERGHLKEVRRGATPTSMLTSESA